MISAGSTEAWSWSCPEAKEWHPSQSQRKSCLNKMRLFHINFTDTEVFVCFFPRKLFIEHSP